MVLQNQGNRINRAERSVIIYVIIIVTILN